MLFFASYSSAYLIESYRKKSCLKHGLIHWFHSSSSSGRGDGDCNVSLDL